jgi:hypothetical protein
VIKYGHQMARSFASADGLSFGPEDSVSTLTWLPTKLLFVWGTTERNARNELFKGEVLH